MKNEEVVEIEKIKGDCEFQDIHTETNNYFAEGILVHNCRPHKRSEVLGYYVPSYVKEMLQVASFIDTSGSISQQAIAEFKAENVGIARAFESVQIHLGYIDVQVHDVLEVTNGNTDKIVDFVPKGGGGTDMRNVFTWLDRNLPDAELVVIFTDGYTPWPKPEQLSGRKVLWLVNTKEKVPSGIGEVIRYDSEESG